MYITPLILVYIFNYKLIHSIFIISLTYANYHDKSTILFCYITILLTINASSFSKKCCWNYDSLILLVSLSRAYTTNICFVVPYLFGIIMDYTKAMI